VRRQLLKRFETTKPRFRYEAFRRGMSVIDCAVRNAASNSVVSHGLVRNASAPAS
jgi:hypothetical protein